MKRVLHILTILFTLNLSAQENSDNSRLEVLSFIDKERVLLRWAPKNSISWLQGNKNGYSVFRKVVMREGIIIQNFDSILVGKYSPLPLEKWNPFADSTYHAVAAEAIYGHEFELTAQSKTFFDLINRSKEQESRFSIGLLCADQSFTVACMMGLGLVDTTVKCNETYLYKVVMNPSETIPSCVSGYAVVDFGYGNFTPRPFGLSSQVKDNIITILIPFHPFKGVYNNFDVQRSDDGKLFFPINSKSHYSMSTSKDDPQCNIYVDSVALKAKTFFYRVRGKTPFDTYGPFSDTISVKIMPSLIGVPWITDIKEIGNGKLTISWETPTYQKVNLKGYMVYTSKKYDGLYHPEIKSLIDSDNKTTLVDVPNGFAYFRIGAIVQAYWTNLEGNLGLAGFYPFTGDEKNYGVLFFAWSTLMGVLLQFSYGPYLQKYASMDKPKTVSRSYMLGVIFGSGRLFLILGFGVATLAALGTQQPSDFVMQNAGWSQMATPYYLAHHLPPVLMGFLLACLLFADITSTDQYLLSWSTSIVNDCILPMRKRAITQLEQITLVRRTIMSLCVLFFLTAIIYRPTMPIWEFLWLCANIIGGSGIAVLAGMYWKRANTYGAYAAVLVNVILPVGDQVARYFTPATIKFPFTPQQTGFWSYILGMIALVVVSLLTPDEKKFWDLGKRVKELNRKPGVDPASQPQPTEVSA